MALNCFPNHNFDMSTLTCKDCGATMELLEWQNEQECSFEAARAVKRDRHFYELGCASRDDEVRDLELKVICLELLLLRSQEILTRSEEHTSELQSRRDLV